MKIFEHFNSDYGDVCPICKTAIDCKTILIPIPGTEDGNIFEAQQMHKECYDFLISMNDEIN